MLKLRFFACVFEEFNKKCLPSKVHNLNLFTVSSSPLQCYKIYIFYLSSRKSLGRIKIKERLSLFCLPSNIRQNKVKMRICVNFWIKEITEKKFLTHVSYTCPLHMFLIHVCDTCSLHMFLIHNPYTRSLYTTPYTCSESKKKGTKHVHNSKFFKINNIQNINILLCGKFFFLWIILNFILWDAHYLWKDFYNSYSKSIFYYLFPYISYNKQEMPLYCWNTISIDLSLSLLFKSK